MAAPRRDQPVLVTGANSGLGLATVLAVAEAGFPTVGTVRSEAKADVVATAAAEAGVEVTTHLLDVTDTEGCVAAIDEHRPWGLVNNAGQGTVGAIEDVDDAEARHILELMVVAPMRLARLALPHQRALDGGRIVNVSSIYGFASTALSGWYQGAKHALEGVSDALRMEVSGDDIDVILVQPGGFKTHIWEEVADSVEARGDSRYQASYDRSQTVTDAWQRFMGSPDDVADVVVRALTTRWPRTRYLVGRDAWAIAAADRLSPTPVLDRLTRFALGL